jgi:hypothetical protein
MTQSHSAAWRGYSEGRYKKEVISRGRFYFLRMCESATKGTIIRSMNDAISVLPSLPAVTILLADVLPPVGFAEIAQTSALDDALNCGETVVSAGSLLEDAVLSTFGANDGTTGNTTVSAMDNTTGSATPKGISIAAITRAVESITAPELPQNQTWLRADPVHFAVSRDNVQLFDSHVVKPTAAEMLLIAETLNKHFAQDGLSIDFPDPARGYVMLSHDDVPNTTPLWLMSGANVFDNLPQKNTTSTKTNWRAITNEVQMLLHEHPVNVAREANGLPAINGLWFWGDGSVPALVKRYDTLVGRLILARGLAALQDVQITPLTEKFSVTGLNGKSLIVLHQATREVRAQSPLTWREAVSAIDSQWIAPAMAAFDAKQIATLKLIIANESKTLTINVQRRHVINTFWRRFKKRKTLRDA